MLTLLGEHGLKVWAKLIPSCTTQTTHGVTQFIEQLEQHLYEQTLIDKAYSVLVPRKLEVQKIRSVLELPTFAINYVTKTSFRCNGKLTKHKRQNIELELSACSLNVERMVENRRGPAGHDVKVINVDHIGS
jgi:hypothetical protein